MARSIHKSTARHILNSGDTVDISVWKSDGSILELRYVISLRYDFYGDGVISSFFPPVSLGKFAISLFSELIHLRYIYKEIAHFTKHIPRDRNTKTNSSYDE